MFYLRVIQQKGEPIVLKSKGKTATACVKNNEVFFKEDAVVDKDIVELWIENVGGDRYIRQLLWADIKLVLKIKD